MPKHSNGSDVFFKQLKKIFPSIFSDDIPTLMLPLFTVQFLESEFEYQNSRKISESRSKKLPKEFRFYAESVNKILKAVDLSSSKEGISEKILKEASVRIMKYSELKLNNTQLLFLKNFIKDALTDLQINQNEKDIKVLISLMHQVFKFFGSIETISVLLKNLKEMSKEDISFELKQALCAFQDKFLETVLPLDKLKTLTEQQKIALSKSMMKLDEFQSYYLSVIMHLGSENKVYSMEELNLVVNEQIGFLRQQISKCENNSEMVSQIYQNRIPFIQELLHKFLQANPNFFNGDKTELSMRETIRNFNKLLYTFRDWKVCAAVAYFNPVIYADSDLLAMPKSDIEIFAAIEKEYQQQSHEPYNLNAKPLPLTPGPEATSVEEKN